MAEAVQALHNQDRIKFQNLSAAIGSSASAGAVSFEGEPIYADRAWDDLHDFSYGVVIPALAQELSGQQPRLDVLYDDLTVEDTDFTEDYFLGQITGGLATHNGTLRDLSIQTTSERDMFDRAQEWIDELRGRGVTKQLEHSRVLELVVPGQKPVALTARSGRPTCPVLDAVYQKEKAEHGVSTAVLVHNTNFTMQQREMQTILTAVHGELPFDSLVNVFIRERKGALRLAATRQTDKAGQTVEIT
jgi:hypothetical protein